MTIQMTTNTSITGTMAIPAPSLATVNVVNGCATVNPSDVPIAIRALGWGVMANQPWPASMVNHLSAPAGAWPTSGTLTLPDNSTAAVTGPLGTVGTITGGSAYTNGTYNGVPLTGGSGSGAVATITVAGGAVTGVVITAGGYRYSASDTVSAAAASLGGTGSGFSVPIATLSRTDVLMPIAWVNWATSFGWYPTPILSAYE